MRTKRLLLVLAVGLLLFALPSALFGQSCALCYTQAASSTQHFIQALRSGILILMFPPFCLSIAVTVVAYKRRNRFYEPWHRPEGGLRNSGEVPAG